MPLSLLMEEVAAAIADYRGISVVEGSPPTKRRFQSHARNIVKIIIYSLNELKTVFDKISWH